MRTQQARWSAQGGWEPPPSTWGLGGSAQVVFLFGSTEQVIASGSIELLRRTYPKAHLVGCSTSGEIHDVRILDDTVVITAVAFEHSRVATSRVPIDGLDGSFDAGKRLIQSLDPHGLRHVFVLSEGLKVNASELVRGLDDARPNGVTTSGGCAGDGNRLRTTHVWCDAEPEESTAVALGFYGERLQVGVSAFGGWRPFGPDRLITKSRQNVVYEFDGRPALALYKRYLGKYADELPASGLMFPLELRAGDEGESVMRALLGIDEEAQSITYAGNVPEGARARFMFGRHEDLIAGAHLAARQTRDLLDDAPPDLSLVVSCNGRRYLLKQRTEEELEAARESLGRSTAMAGFYSYGEIAPAKNGGRTELHNETMTITSLSER